MAQPPIEVDQITALPAFDGTNITNVDAASLGGVADTAYAKLAAANIFVGLQTITHTGTVGLNIQDTDGGAGSTINFIPAGSSNFSATINNDVTGSSEQLLISKQDGAGVGASFIKLHADGEATLENIVNPATVSINAAGAITINAASGERITSSDEHRFFTTATFTQHTVVAGTSIDWTIGNKVTCSAGGTLTFIDPPAPCSLVLVLTAQPNLPASVQWPDGGAEPAKTGTSVIGLYFDGTTYYAMQSTNFV